MSIKVKLDFDFGDSCYIKTDPEQLERTVVGAIMRPGAVIYILDTLGEEIEIYNFQLSKEKNLDKSLDLKKPPDGDDT